jgi:hypothetical protein
MVGLPIAAAAGLMLGIRSLSARRKVPKQNLSA